MVRRRRSAESDSITTIYWRDIPAQVVASGGGQTHKVMLENRFQLAIDRAAIVADLTDTDAYVEQWRRETKPLAGLDPVEAAEAAIVELTDHYTKQRLETLVSGGGTNQPTSSEEPSP